MTADVVYTCCYCHAVIRTSREVPEGQALAKYGWTWANTGHGWRYVCGACAKTHGGRWE